MGLNKTHTNRLCTFECVTMTAAVDIKPLTIIKSEKVDGKSSFSHCFDFRLLLNASSSAVRSVMSNFYARRGFVCVELRGNRDSCMI